MRVVQGFFRFWWDFVVGDDWRIAAAVAAVLALAGIVVSVTSPTGAWFPAVVGAALGLAFVAVVTAGLRRP